VAIEVKTSQHGQFSDPPADLWSFLKARAALAAAGKGFWSHTPPGVSDFGRQVRNMMADASTAVTGYKIEVHIPANRQAGTPVVIVKRWGH
jgi:hypothetical protein